MEMYLELKLFVLLNCFCNPNVALFMSLRSNCARFKEHCWLLYYHINVTHLFPTPTLCVTSQAVTWCRSAMVMMQYSVMANNYWLLVEGIYLHSLLVITVFSEKKYFYIYLAIGWGKKHNCC